MKFRPSTKVKWKTDGGYAQGTVKETYDQTVIKTIQGLEYTKFGKPEDLALLIEQETGENALMLESEVLLSEN